MDDEKCRAMEGLEESLRQQQTQLLRQLETQLKQQLTETQGRLTVSYLILLLTNVNRMMISVRCMFKQIKEHTIKSF